MGRRVRMTVHVRPVALSTRTPASPCARSATAQNSAGRVSARIPAAQPEAEALTRNQSDVSRAPRKAVIPASGAPRSICMSLGAVWTEVEGERDERRERSAWCGVDGVGGCVFWDSDDEGAEWRVRRGTAPASGTEQASSNRALAFSFPFDPAPAPLFFRDAAGGVGVGVSPARRSAVH